jgi:phage terminase large subunit-like protein
MPWQKFGFLNIMGFYSHETKERRFRTAHWDVARGAGKSAMASQACLYFLALDDPIGNEVYCAASKKEQARLVLDSARAMANKNKDFISAVGVDVRAHSILHEESDSFVKALSSKSDSTDGLAAVLIVTDELHAMAKNMFDVLDSGQSKRRDSLLLSITTAGFSLIHAGYSQRSYAQKVSLGEVADETFFAMVYRIDEEDEEDALINEECWIKANPGLYEINDLTNLRAKAKKALNSPADRPNFFCKHLNLYQNALNQFFNVKRWDECADEGLKIEDLYGQPCYVGIDMSSKNDITSFSYVFNIDGKYILYNECFCPKLAIETTENMNYHTYEAEGSLIVTPGEAIDYDTQEERFLMWNEKFKIKESYYDSWQANQFAIRMKKQGIEMVEFRMSTSNLSEPTKILEAATRDKTLRHFGTEMLSWMIGNVVCKFDAANNVYPRKENEKNKIDGAISSIMALAGWVNEEKEESVYETRGIITF